MGVLTNAHVVNEAVLIHVVKAGSTKKERAKVVKGAFSVDLDLAILQIDNAGFWENISPLTLSPRLPELFSDVMVVGFPAGGRQVCVTKGVVSRITTSRFAIDGFPSPELLAVQIDAAINPGKVKSYMSYKPCKKFIWKQKENSSFSHDFRYCNISLYFTSGNSGGPALSPVGNICYGVAALKDSSSHIDNVGYIIPSLTVRSFLEDGKVILY